MSDATDAAGRIAAFLDSRPRVNPNVRTRPNDECIALNLNEHDAATPLLVADLRQLLAEHAAATARVAELEQLRDEPRASCHLCRIPLGIVVCSDCATDLAAEGVRQLAQQAAASPHPAETEAPLCAHCGERRRDGSYNEHDRSWQCAPCHMAAARGETR